MGCRASMSAIRSHISGDRAIKVTLIALILADTAFIGANSAARAALELFPDSLWIVRSNIHFVDVWDDRSFAEAFNTIKLAAIPALLFLLWTRVREPIYLAWFSIFLFAVVDDAGSLHERGGNLTEGWLGPNPGLGYRGQDVGELATWVLVGVLLLPLLVASYRRSCRLDRRLGRWIAVCFAGLAVFAVGVDMSHPLWPAGFDIRRGILEDGGEMLAVSLTCAVVLLIVRHRGDIAQALGEPSPSSA